jgi:hypothetical protein
MANPLDYLKNLIPENTNIFGASPDSNLKQLSSLGLLGDEAGYKKALESANRQSIFQGLLNTGLSYAAQPQNQNYGTIVPYIAKAGLAGMEAAQKPFDKLASNAMTNAQLKALLAKENESIFAKESQSKYTPESVEESIMIKKAGGTDEDARAVLRTLPNQSDGSEYQSKPYFVKNNKTQEMYPVTFNKTAKGNKYFITKDGIDIPVTQDMFGEDGMSFEKLSEKDRISGAAFNTLSSNLTAEENSLNAISKYITDVESLPTGIQKWATQLSTDYKALFDQGLTADEIKQRLTEGTQQGLLGKLRLEIVGGGVMTEPDAQKIIARLGGLQASAFTNPQVVAEAMGEVLSEKYNNYQTLLRQYNNAVEYGGYGNKYFPVKNPLYVDPKLFRGLNSPANLSKTQTTTTNTGLPTIEQIEAEQKRRQGGK